MKFPSTFPPQLMKNVFYINTLCSGMFTIISQHITTLEPTQAFTVLRTTVHWSEPDLDLWLIFWVDGVA